MSPQPEPGPELLGSVLARVTQELHGIRTDRPADLVRDREEQPAMSTDHRNPNLPLADRYRLLAAAARKEGQAKPWAAEHYRTCATQWEDQARRAEQQPSAPTPAVDEEGVTR